MGRPQFFTIDPSHQLARGLVFAGLGHAPGSARYHDSSVYGNHGVLTDMEPATDWTAAPHGRQTLLFDGVNDSVNFSPNALPASITHWSASFWTNHTFNSAIRSTVFGRVDALAGNLIITFYLNQLRVYYSSYNWTLTCTAATASGLHHWTVTRLGSVMVLYRDAQYLSTDTNESAVAHNFNLITRLGMFGSSYFGPNSISDPMLYDRVLSGAEIQQLADPSNYMLSGLIKPIGQASNIYDLAGIR